VIHTIYKIKDLDTDNLEESLKHNLTNVLTANKNTARYSKQYALKAQLELQL